MQVAGYYCPLAFGCNNTELCYQGPAGTVSMSPPPPRP
jgi:hypothetical protein